MLSLDEVITHAREKAEEMYLQGMLCHANPNDDELDGCIECAKEHEQLAEWLEDYRRIKMLVPIEQALKAEYIKAIDDFYNALADDLIWIKERFGDDVYTDLWCDVGTRAEQLKAGGGNEE